MVMTSVKIMSTTATSAAVAVLVLVVMAAQQTTATPLDDYVNAPDNHYSWSKLPWEHRGPDFTIYALNMTSQKWLTEKDSSQPVWWHYMYVVVPDVIKHPEASFLYVSLGSNSLEFEPKDDEFVVFITLMAVSTGTVTANLRQIPNQPIVFTNDPSLKSRKEDAVIAWTWYQFINYDVSPEWLLRLPMTKATVRAMDTITAFTKTIRPDVTVSKFMVCGESKRGWTTWTTAAVDKRVVAIAPMVMDLLNFVKSLHHHYQSLGGWTFAFNDYYQLNITLDLDHPKTKQLADIVNPYAYLDRLTMPKYIITTGGDQFFLPDDSYYYFSQVKGETYLRTIPNAEHSLTTHRPGIFFGVRAFFLSVIEGTPRPNMTWTKDWTKTGATLTMFTDTKPLSVDVHFAHTIDENRRRDFRLQCLDPMDPEKVIVHPVVWEVRPVNITHEGQEYYATFDNPESGWTAFHIHAIFKGPDGSDFEFTTENVIVPNVLPYDPCKGDSCYGKLV